MKTLRDGRSPRDLKGIASSGLIGRATREQPILEQIERDAEIRSLGHALFQLRDAAAQRQQAIEVEHALMVQYLYATTSVTRVNGQPATSTAALPFTSLNGSINTILSNNVVTTQITPTLKSKLGYRYYGYDNGTPAQLFNTWVGTDRRRSVSDQPRINRWHGGLHVA